MTVDWSGYGVYQDIARELPTDWVHVLSIMSGGGYNWTDFHAFWSPTARRYFWLGGSGCSCNSWGTDIDSASDFEDGDRGALRRAIRGFSEEHTYAVTAGDVIDALDDLARFKENA